MEYVIINLIISIRFGSNERASFKKFLRREVAVFFRFRSHASSSDSFSQRVSRFVRNFLQNATAVYVIFRKMPLSWMLDDYELATIEENAYRPSAGDTLLPLLPSKKERNANFFIRFHAS